MAIALDTLAYARRLREAGFSEQQAEGQAQALAAAMTDTLATKQDLGELETHMDARFVASAQDLRELQARIDTRFAQVDARFDYLEKHLDTRLAEQEKRLETRLAEQEKRIDIRFNEQAAHFRGQLADLERRVTVRLGGMMVAAIGAVSALVKLL